MGDVGAPDRFAGLALLALVLREDRRTILSPDVVALAIELRRVVNREEDVEQIVIAQLVIVEGDPDRLGVAGIAAADLLVGGIFGASAGVAAFDLLHAHDVEENRLGAPKAPACQHRDLFGHVTAPSAVECR